MCGLHYRAGDLVARLKGAIDDGSFRGTTVVIDLKPGAPGWGQVRIGEPLTSVHPIYRESLAFGATDRCFT